MFILVVEDDFHTRRSLDIILRTEGHTVEIAETGEEGLSFAREFKFDAMILDMMLPGRVRGTTIDALAEARAYDAANAGRAA